MKKEIENFSVNEEVTKITITKKIEKKKKVCNSCGIEFPKDSKTNICSHCGCII